jgi:4-hydroxythreonine-4-phosphate dehydrogenase
MSNHRPFVITPGEPAGIGAEITLKSWLAGQRDICILECPHRLQRIAENLGLDIAFQPLDHIDEFTPQHDKLQVLPLHWPATPLAGSPDSQNGQVVIDAISAATDYCQSTAAAGMVTNPIQKSTLYEAGFAFPGHTEFLASKAKIDAGGPMMMLACDALRVVPLTIHVPLAAVPTMISSTAIVTAATLLSKNLQRFFGIDDPHIAICGLNPHAGENGTIGQEDRDIIMPAIADLQAAGVTATGPYPADTLFHEAARARYDAVLGMYHDQVLIPIKTLDFFGGVNITLGLDFIRTSPDHGTGLDIAGTGTARPDSLIAAINMARKMAVAANSAKP